MYRINFGNGTVYGEGESLRSLRHWLSLWGDAYSYIERQDPQTGDWFKVRR